MATFTAYIEFDPDTGLYVGTVPGINGAHTQGATLEELHENLKDVLELCLEELPDIPIDLPHFVCLQQITITKRFTDRHTEQ